MKKRILSFLTFSLFALSGTAQDVATLCCDNIDVMRIEFYFDKALQQKDTLTRLDVSMQHPKLTEVPKQLVQFRALKYLNLGFNKLTAISPSLALLRNLECLDLSGNYNLYVLPDFLNKLPKLKIIRLQDMPHWNDKKKEELQKNFPNIKLVF